MKINWSVNEERSLITVKDKMKPGDAIYIAKRIYNKPIKGKQEAKKMLFDIGNTTIHSVDHTGFWIENKFGSRFGIGYTQNEKDCLFYKYKK